MKKLIIDNFAGGGGASTGIELALGRPVDIAINHDKNAILMHEANHPFTIHIKNDVFAVDPIEITKGQPVELAWFSPDCTHFSKAKGGKPRKQEIRDLAWIVIKWAKLKKPSVIMLENVEEFKTWGPLDENGYPIKERSGETFNEWLSELKSLGYEVQMKELRACDYGAPTIRKRLFIIARCDGKPITWPKPTHGEGLLPYKTAADIIDFSIRGKSIFNRKKELAENTMRRIARGLDKFVINNPKPYIISYHSETQPNEVRGHSIDEPLATQGTANRFGLVTPVITKIGQTKFSNDRSSAITEPIKTIVSKNEDLLLTPELTPFLVVNTSGHNGGDVQDPLHTVTTGNQHIIVEPRITPFIAVQRKDQIGNIEDPLNTLTAINHEVLVNPVIVPVGYGEAPGQQPRVQDTKQPLNTIVSHSTKHHIVTYIGKEFSDNNGKQIQGSDVSKPLPAITAVDHNRVINAVFTQEYFGNAQHGQDIKKPLHTITSMERQSLMTIKLNSLNDLGNWPLIRQMLNKHSGYTLSEDEVIIFEINGSWFIMTDIEMRMLEPKELYAAQGFPTDYNIDLNGKLSRSEQVKKCGNSVCPPVASAIVKANVTIDEELPIFDTMSMLHQHIATYQKYSKE